jgi:hypothetical protein
VINEYNLLELAHAGWVYIGIQKGMYILPQAGILANTLLLRRLALDGYHSTEHTHGLWKHEARPVWFSLVVDDFVIKYIGCEHAEHFIIYTKKKYEISRDWTGCAYCGLKIYWDYNNKTVDLYMPGYINTVVHNNHYPDPALAEHAPHTWNPPVYGAKTQYTEKAGRSCKRRKKAS